MDLAPAAESAGSAVSAAPEIGLRTGDVGPACARAVDFLLAAREPDQSWRDFDVAGPSDAWVTAYVASALARTGSTTAWDAAGHAWQLLVGRRRWSAGWGYNSRVPADADSTAWALTLAGRLGVQRSVRSWRARRFLAGHTNAGGGVSTYRLAGPIRAFTRLEARFSGWTSPHVCVSAVVAAIPGMSDAEARLTFLRTRQAEDGSWTAYWWHDAEFATAWAVDALVSRSHTGDVADGERIERAVRWAFGRVDPDGRVRTTLHEGGSPTATAMAVRILAHSTDGLAVAARRRAMAWLVVAQRANGSWEPSSRLRVPPPDVADAASIESWGRGGQGEASIGNVLCDRGIHTTATVLDALREPTGR